MQSLEVEAGEGALPVHPGGGEEAEEEGGPPFLQVVVGGAGVLQAGPGQEGGKKRV